LPSSAPRSPTTVHRRQSCGRTPPIDRAFYPTNVVEKVDQLASESGSCKPIANQSRADIRTHVGVRSSAGQRDQRRGAAILLADSNHRSNRPTNMSWQKHPRRRVLFRTVNAAQSNSLYIRPDHHRFRADGAAARIDAGAGRGETSPPRQPPAYTKGVVGMVGLFVNPWRD